MKGFLKFIDSISEWSGKIVSPLVFAITAVMLYEIVARYVFNSPTTWSFEVSASIYGVYAVLLGAYVLQRRSHVNVDLVTKLLSPRAMAIVNLFTWLLFFAWIIVLMWQGWEMSWESWAVREGYPTTFGCPIYPIKSLLPFGAFLLFLQGLAEYIRNVIFAITGKEA